MANETKLPTKDELASLPPTRSVAYAARCARRVQPLFALWDYAAPSHCHAIETAVQLAENFVAEGYLSAAAAKSLIVVVNAVAETADFVSDATQAAYGDDATEAAYAAANAAADAARATDAAEAEDAALAAYGAADAAAGAANADAGYLKAGRADFEKLKALRVDVPFDPSANGLLGPLWPEGDPRWYTDAKKKWDALIAQVPQEEQGEESNDKSGDQVKLFGKLLTRSKILGILERRSLDEQMIVHMRLGLTPNGDRSSILEIAGQTGKSEEEVIDILNLNARFLATELGLDVATLSDPLTLMFDTAVFDEEEIAEILSIVSGLYSLETGDELVLADGMFESDLARVFEPEGA